MLSSKWLNNLPGRERARDVEESMFLLFLRLPAWSSGRCVRRSKWGRVGWLAEGWLESSTANPQQCVLTTSIIIRIRLRRFQLIRSCVFRGV